ncbi:MAG: peroxidase [Nitrospira sp.]
MIPYGERRLEYHDIQGLVQHDYVELPSAIFVLCQVTDPERAHAWLAGLVEQIERVSRLALDHPRRTSAVHVAFTSHGLSALGVAAEVLNQFPREFREGMATLQRERLLGDRGESRAVNWEWGAERDSTRADDHPRPDPRLHVMLMVYAHDADMLRDRIETLLPRGTDQGLRELKRFDTVFLAGPEREADGRLVGPKEHFGFRDGIGQPHVAGMPPSDPNVNPAEGNTIAPGEVLLGYANSYGEMPEGPTDVHGLGFGRNGTFLVFRQLRQDVKQFWDYVAACSDSEADAAIKLAAKMVGRWPDGTPLVVSPNHSNPEARTHNQFLYASDRDHPDPYGTRCPIGAHIRRTNPRDSLGDDPAQALELANQHRIIRRSRAYGPPLVENMDPKSMMGAVDNGAERGLHFLCLNAAIDRQFEFVQSLWANNPKFGNLYEDPDPLIGVQDGRTGQFTVQGQPIRCRYSNMQRFVQVRGGAYFFLPGIEAIRTLARNSTTALSR